MKKSDYDRIIENRIKELLYKNLVAVYELKTIPNNYEKDAKILADICYSGIKYIIKQEHKEMNFYNDNEGGLS